MIYEYPPATGLLTAAEFRRLRENAVRTRLAPFDPFENYHTFTTRQFGPLTELSTRLISGRSLKTKLLQGTCAVALVGMGMSPLYSTAQLVGVGPLTLREPANLLVGGRATVFAPSDRTIQHAVNVSPLNGKNLLTDPAPTLIDLANDVLADSRPMTDWEQKVTDDFFWSQFS